MARKVISISLDEELLRNIDEETGKGSRNKWIVQAIRDALSKPAEKEFTVKEKVEKVESDARMNKLLDEGLVKALQQKTEKGENPFEQLTGLEIAKLMAQRSPKDKNVDEDLEADYLSLTNILKRLPAISDITKELSRVKGLNKKLCGELEILDEIVKVQNKRLKKDFSGADKEIKSIIGRVIAISKDVKLEYDVRGMIYKGLLDGEKQ